MGLLGNVAEVPDLRQKLMTKAFVAEFAMLLDSSLDGIEVSRKSHINKLHSLLLKDP